MLAQHIITRPVFDALFADYQFVNNNAVSRSMQRMIDLLQEQAFEKDTEVLEKFYQSVRTNVGGIDNLEGKQTIIKNLYEKFFKGAFPLTVEKLGIVYTPVECVDFIIHSVNDILKAEFDTSLTEQNVHILDPFVGTGTFITRLLQSGLIRPEDMERKYLNEIHCNEIVLLAYYIADVNIESVFHDITSRKTYLPYSGICLTDTFQLAEKKHNELFTEFFQDNSKRVKKQMATHVRVIVGNPPYSIGQKSANDNAQNLSYPYLDNRVSETYAVKSSATLNKSLYDSYVKAFRWASDRIPQNDGGIVAFISNGAWLDGAGQDGIRDALREDPDVIMVGELRDRETLEAALHAAETGHLVMATMHTQRAVMAVHRMISLFPGEQQEEIRNQISQVLRAVICQRLLRWNKKFITIRDILLNTHAVANLIRTRKEPQIISIQETQLPMKTLEMAVRDVKAQYGAQQQLHTLLDQQLS